MGISAKSYWAANLYDLRRVFHDVRVLRQFKRAGVETDEEIYKFARRMSIGQIYEEIKWVADLIREHKPQNLIEIGTQRGGNAFFLSNFMPEGSTLVTIDVAPQLSYRMAVHNYQRMKARKTKTGQRIRKSWRPFSSGSTVFRHRLIRHFSNSNCQVVPFYTYLNPIEDAHFLSVSVLGGQEFGVVFYDADKNEYGTRSILEAYLPLLKQDGLLIIQDINYRLDSGSNGPALYWRGLDESRFKKVGELIVREPDTVGGIGVAVKL